MQIAIFTLPAFSGEKEQEQLNLFLRSHKIFSLEKEFVNDGASSYWSVWIQYDGFKTVDAQNMKAKKKSKIDYKEVLEPDIFLIFSRLREIRKEIAIEDGVAVYIVFSNEELAQIAALDEITVSNIKKIEGIGEKRAEKYGRKLIEKFNQTKL